MTWKVSFPRVVIYQPDHPLVRREVIELIVHADTAQGAIIHALRVVSGDVEGLTAEPFLGTLGTPPLPEPFDDVPLSFSVG